MPMVAASSRLAPARNAPGLQPGQQAFLLLQDKWAMFIIDTLGGDRMGFNELSRVAACINPATLSQRLTMLERAGLLTKEVHSTMPPRSSYALTLAGQALLPVLADLKRWGERHLPIPDLGCDQG